MKRRTLQRLPLGLERAYAAEVVENDDGTVDLVGVEIMAAGGPIHGIGSPPEGDYWTTGDLEAMASAAAELGEEWEPPNKIGHADEQVLVRNSIEAGDLPAPTDGEMPAVGWLANQRVDGDRLLADIRKVPKVVGDLIQKGAWRKRSVELSKVTSQKTGKTYPWVVGGLSWLGGKMPAIRTLADVVALYEGLDDDRRLYFADALTIDARRSDTGATMRYSEEQIRKFAAAVGLDADKVTETMLEDAGVEPVGPDAPPAPAPTHVTDPPPPPADDKPADDDKADDDATARELAATQERVKALELENHLERRRSFVDGALRAKKVLPGQRESLETYFDRDPEAARAFVDGLPVRADAEEFGADEDLTAEERELEEASRSYAEEAAGRLGIDKDKIV